MSDNVFITIGQDIWINIAQIISVTTGQWSKQWDGETRGKEGDLMLLITTTERYGEDDNYTYRANLNTHEAQDAWTKIRTNCFKVNDHD